MREKIHFYLGLYPKAVLLLNKINTLYTKILRFGSRQEEDIDKIYMGLHEDAILKIILFLPPNLEDSTGLSCNYFKTLPIYRYMYLETDIYIKRYIYRLYKLEQHHIWLKEWERKWGSSSLPLWILMAFLGMELAASTKHQREVSLRNSFYIWHKHIKVIWNLRILYKIYPYLKVKFCPSAFSIFKI